MPSSNCWGRGRPGLHQSLVHHEVVPARGRDDHHHYSVMEEPPYGSIDECSGHRRSPSAAGWRSTWGPSGARRPADPADQESGSTPPLGVPRRSRVPSRRRPAAASAACPAPAAGSGHRSRGHGTPRGKVAGWHSGSQAVCSRAQVPGISAILRPLPRGIPLLSGSGYSSMITFMEYFRRQVCPRQVTLPTHT